MIDVNYSAERTKSLIILMQRGTGTQELISLGFSEREIADCYALIKYLQKCFENETRKQTLC